MDIKGRLLEIDKKQISGVKIIGYNLLAIVCYTIIYVTLTIIGAAEEGIFLDFCLVVLHLVFCILMAINGKRAGVWPLSAVLVFVIGFTTLVMIGLGLKGGV